MARIARGRNPKAQEYAALRTRGRREVSRLEALYRQMSPTQQAGKAGQLVRYHTEEIERQMERTKLGRKATKDDEFNARMAANRVESLIPKKGTRESSKSANERASRIYREQMRRAETGGDTVVRGGQGRHLERIFYMSTQALWEGSANEDRDQLIMKALGVDTLAEAYNLVMLQNVEAIAALKDLGDDDMAWVEGYYTALAYITNMANFVR